MQALSYRIVNKKAGIWRFLVDSGQTELTPFMTDLRNSAFDLFHFFDLTPDLVCIASREGFRMPRMRQAVDASTALVLMRQSRKLLSSLTVTCTMLLILACVSYCGNQIAAGVETWQ